MVKNVFILFVFSILSVPVARGSKTCMEPAEKFLKVQGHPGEVVMELALGSEGFWSSTVQDVTSGTDISEYFKTGPVNQSDTLHWAVTVARFLPAENRLVPHEIKFTLHCYIDGHTKPFFRRGVLLANKASTDNVTSMIEFTIFKDTPVGSVLYLMHLHYPTVSSANLVFTVIHEDGLNDVSAQYLNVTKTGVITLKKSLESFSDQLLLLLLHKKLPAPGETVPVVVYVVEVMTPIDPEASSEQTPRFVLEHCQSRHCHVGVYRVEADSQGKGELTSITPSQLLAMCSCTVNYFIIGGNPESYRQFFSINSSTGAVYHEASDPSGKFYKFFLVIKAQNSMVHYLFDTALLFIQLIGSNPLSELAPTTSLSRTYQTRSTPPITTTPNISRKVFGFFPSLDEPAQQFTDIVNKIRHFSTQPSTAIADKTKGPAEDEEMATLEGGVTVQPERQWLSNSASRDRWNILILSLDLLVLAGHYIDVFE
ncbi:uncharacterized protein LOC131933304 [Physella acuta]|uniref:uncharacterized protein LOC131933304 n=1 Tax=Physella acuta TaxID=109671 RepID=UPI0027DCCC54|nr:uncharacterized protein LOC131933304 [Physella acuta]